MKENNNTYAKSALTITTVLTLTVAGFEVLQSCRNYKEGMNLLDFASYSTADINAYCLVLILTNLILLPGAIMLYKSKGISLKEEIYDKKTLGKDILIGIAVATVSSLISLVYLHTYSGRTELAFAGWSHLSPGTIILMVISLVFASGICKEIYFRGFARNFCSEGIGETTALLLFNVMFGALDWFNMGQSFIMGLVWAYAYQKRKHLIVPMIAHGGMNLIAIVYYIITLEVFK